MRRGWGRRCKNVAMGGRDGLSVSKHPQATGFLTCTCLPESGFGGTNWFDSFTRRRGQADSRAKTREDQRLTLVAVEGLPSRTADKSFRAVPPHLDHWQSGRLWRSAKALAVTGSSVRIGHDPPYARVAELAHATALEAVTMEVRILSWVPSSWIIPFSGMTFTYHPVKFLGGPCSSQWSLS